MITKRDMNALLHLVEEDFGQHYDDTTVSSWCEAFKSYPTITVGQAANAVSRLASDPSNQIYRLRPYHIIGEIKRMQEPTKAKSARERCDDLIMLYRICGSPEEAAHKPELYRQFAALANTGMPDAEAFSRAVHAVLPNTRLTIKQPITLREWEQQKEARHEPISPNLPNYLGDKRQEARQ